MSLIFVIANPTTKFVISLSTKALFSEPPSNELVLLAVENLPPPCRHSEIQIDLAGSATATPSFQRPHLNLMMKWSTRGYIDGPWLTGHGEMELGIRPVSL